MLCWRGQWKASRSQGKREGREEGAASARGILTQRWSSITRLLSWLLGLKDVSGEDVRSHGVSELPIRNLRTAHQHGEGCWEGEKDGGERG